MFKGKTSTCKSVKSHTIQVVETPDGNFTVVAKCYNFKLQARKGVQYHCKRSWQANGKEYSKEKGGYFACVKESKEQFEEMDEDDQAAWNVAGENAADQYLEDMLTTGVNSALPAGADDDVDDDSEE